ncbi:MAG: DUF3667 domain-containing protein [Bacteroidales bacterium]|jgi:hypothetical protein|nr:DUF3667 domain-containing protein [Bacteroidales bacterium]
MAKKDEIKKVEFKNQELTKYDFIICPNCGTKEIGNFCSNCGQSNKDYNKPIREIFGDLLDSINLDIRLLNTLIPFFTKPGFLAQEYFKGKRKKYVPPMRMYILFSVLFFFLAQFADMDDFKNLGTLTTDSVADSIKHDLATALNGSDSSFNKMFEKVPQINENSLIDDSSKVDSEKGLFNEIKIVRPEDKDSDEAITLNDLSLKQRKEIVESLQSDTTIDGIYKKGIIGGLKAFEKADLFWEKFFKNISYVLFLLMPFFALILAITLWKSKKMYVHHLIFSINFHSFIFAFSSLLIVLSKILPESIFQFSSYLLWFYPLYLMFGIKRFYKRTHVSAFFKTLGISLMYSFIIFVVILIIGIFTAKGFYEI